MSEHVATSDSPPTTGAGGKGKQVRATDILNSISSVPTERIERPAGEGRRSNGTPSADPVDAPVAAAPPVPREQRRPKPTALKLPASITDELRAAMVYLRAHGAWDTSMSQIAQVGIRRELDHIKKVHGIRAFPPVTESSSPVGE